jgi:diacylglycerol kinase family enzyme
MVAGRPFVNNASFGAYAVVVQSPAYRDDKTRTTLDLLPGLLAGTRSRGLIQLSGPEVVVDADASQIPVGIDGEALLLDTPVRCVVRPAALWVRVPRDRPGVPDPKPIMDWKRLRQIALTVPGTGRG